MDSQLATLFYVGIIVPTIITILVFVGFLVCLYKCNLSRKSSQTERVLPRTPSMSGSCRSRKSNKHDKFESISQHSNDSAIDMREIDANLEPAEKGKTSEVVLDVLKLGKNYHSYQNEGAQFVTEVDVHEGALKKGQYPSHEQLNQEIHSQVKIYEKVSDAQRIALQLINMSENSQKTASQRNDLIKASQKQFSAPRYTSTSKLVPPVIGPKTPISKPLVSLPKGPTSHNNQLNLGTSNYAFIQPYPQNNPSTRASLYQSQYNSWKPNIAASCSSATDNYSTVESSHV